MTPDPADLTNLHDPDVLARALTHALANAPEPADEPVRRSAPKSVFYDKTTPELRRELGRAIIRRTPATFPAIFAHFNLAALGLRFYSFYRYARKIRAMAEKLALLDCVEMEPAKITEAIERLAGTETIDALLYSEEPGAAKKLTRNADIYTRIRSQKLRAERHAADLEIANGRIESRRELTRMRDDSKRELAEIRLNGKRECAEITAQGRRDVAQIRADARRNRREIRDRELMPEFGTANTEPRAQATGSCSAAGPSPRDVGE